MLANSVATEGYGPFTFLYGLAFSLSLVLVGLLVYVAWCAFSVQYRLDKENLTLRYAGVRQVIPLASIEAVYAPGQKIDGTPIKVRWRGMADILPGFLASSGRSPQLGKVVAVATVPADRQVFVVASGVAFGLSPQRPVAFIDELNTRLASDHSHSTIPDPETAHQPHTVLGRWLTLGAGLWADRLARRLLLGGLLVCTLFFGYMSLVYNGLPNILPLHWNSQAQIDRVGDPQELLRLPVIALAIWLLNAVLASLARRRERAATIFLLAGAVAVPLVFAAATLSMVLVTT
jgi:Protein of unknown function (DUF1648)/Bacterial PH domain